MTVAVAVRDERGVWIASDRQMSTGGAKVPLMAKWAVSASRSLAAIIAGPSIVRARLQPCIEGDVSALGAAECIATLVRDTIKHPRHAEQEPPDYGVSGIITDGETILLMTSDLAVHELEQGWAACGTGAPEANAALWTMARLNVPNSLNSRAELAIAAACNLDRACSGLWGPVLVPSAVGRAAMDAMRDMDRQRHEGERRLWAAGLASDVVASAEADEKPVKVVPGPPFQLVENGEDIVDPTDLRVLAAQAPLRGGALYDEEVGFHVPASAAGVEAGTLAGAEPIEGLAKAFRQYPALRGDFGELVPSP